jgi:AcrR family transcriptional regulator
MPTETFFNLPDDKRRMILDLAIEEFADNDYHIASISRVVARAGIAKGSFYQYFADKQDLYLYLLQMAADEKTSFLQASPPPDPEAGFYDMLRWMFHIGFDFEFSNPRLAKIGYRAVYGDAPLPEETAAVLRGSNTAFFGPMVQLGQARGEIDPALPADLVAMMVYGLLSQLGDYLLKRTDMTPDRLLDGGARQLDQPLYWETIDGMMTILERGLRPPVAAGAPAESKNEMMKS